MYNNQILCSLSAGIVDYNSLTTPCWATSPTSPQSCSHSLLWVSTRVTAPTVLHSSSKRSHNFQIKLAKYQEDTRLSCFDQYKARFIQCSLLKLPTEPANWWMIMPRETTMSDALSIPPAGLCLHRLKLPKLPGVPGVPAQPSLYNTNMRNRQLLKRKMCFDIQQSHNRLRLIRRYNSYPPTE